MSKSQQQVTVAASYVSKVESAIRNVQRAESKVTAARWTLGERLSERPEGVSVKRVREEIIRREKIVPLSESAMSKAQTVFSEYPDLDAVKNVPFDMLYEWRPSKSNRSVADIVAAYEAGTLADTPAGGKGTRRRAKGARKAEAEAAQPEAQSDEDAMHAEAEAEAMAEAEPEARESEAARGDSVRITVSRGTLNRLREMRADGESIDDVLQRLIHAQTQKTPRDPKRNQVQHQHVIHTRA